MVSISDSFAWGAVPHYYHFTTVCERAVAGVEVFNLGYPATDVPEYHYVLKYHALPLEPDLIVVNLFVGNDLAIVPSQRHRGLLRRWFDRENLMTYVVATRISVLATDRFSRASELAFDVDVRRDLTYNRMYGLGALHQIGREEFPKYFPWLDGSHEEPATFAASSYLELEQKRALSACYLIARDNAWRQPFFGLIEQMIEAAGDVPVFFVLIPDEFQVEDRLWQAIARATPAALDRDLPQRILKTWFAQRKVACVDLLPHRRAVPVGKDGRRACYHLQDTHFNRRGNEITGKVLAGEISRFVKTRE